MMKSKAIFQIMIVVVCMFAIIRTNAQTGAHSSTPAEPRYQPEPYVPVSTELYDTIVHLDSLYFDTYNTCNLEKMSLLMSDNIEFYHDKGGVSTSKSEILEGIKKNICGKVTRELVKGSIEVYPIHGYGASRNRIPSIS